MFEGSLIILDEGSFPRIQWIKIWKCFMINVLLYSLQIEFNWAKLSYMLPVVSRKKWFYFLLSLVYSINYCILLMFLNRSRVVPFGRFGFDRKINCNSRKTVPTVAYAGKNFGEGFKVMAGLVGGPGVEPPDAGEFSKIFKNIS